MVDEGSILAAEDAKLDPGETGLQTKFTIRNSTYDFARTITIAQRNTQQYLPEPTAVRTAVNALLSAGILLCSGETADTLTAARNVVTYELI